MKHIPPRQRKPLLSISACLRQPSIDSRKGTPLLSICIPTYNRAAALGRTLENLEEEIRGLGGKVEICISDNCSPDDTEKIVGRWKKRLPITCNRNRANMGYDINALRVMRIARGEFCWFVGDDDAAAEGAVKRLLGDIEGQGRELGAIAMAYQYNGKRVPDYGLQKFQAYAIEGKYPPLLIGFMGQICVRRKLAEEIAGKKLHMKGRMLLKREKDPLLLYDYLPTYLFIECLAKGRRFGIEPAPGIKVLASAEAISDEKSMHFGLLPLLYMVHIRKHYPWLCHQDLRRLYVKYHFVKAAIAARRPDLERAYAANRDVLLSLLETYDDKAGIALINAFEAVRKLPFAGAMASGAYLAARKLAGSRTARVEASEYAKKSLELAVERAIKGGYATDWEKRRGHHD